MTTSTRWTLTLTLTLPLLGGCKTEDPVDTMNETGATETAETGATGETGGTEPTAPTTTEPTTTGTAMDCAAIPPLAAIDESSCGPLASDYQPRDGNSANDMWPACIADNPPYPLVEAGTPGSYDRIVAYDMMAALLWNNSADLTPEDFTAARDQYVIPEGLESRLNRREDLHYDAIPMAEWDPMVDSDKQCTVAALADKYPERCAGPKKMKPILDDAFAAGQSGDGDARVHAAKIHATLDWFLWLSVYKEAETCGSAKAADCDSCWAYYTGLEPIASGLGISKDILAESKNTHERIHDGILAVRCWRDLYQDGMGGYPLFPDLDDASLDQFNRGWEQLDQALFRGTALLVRAHAVAYFNSLCGTGDAYQPASWAYLQILGTALQAEADARNAGSAATLASLWASSEPTAQDVADGIAAIDEIFACP
jgi:hypothetical protein